MEEKHCVHSTHVLSDVSDWPLSDETWQDEI